MQPSLDQLFATHCAPALAGVAPANLISLRRGDVPHLEEEGVEMFHTWRKSCGSISRPLPAGV